VPNGGTIFARHASFCENQIYQGLASDLFPPRLVLIPPRTRPLVWGVRILLMLLQLSIGIERLITDFAGSLVHTILGHCDLLD
jgi:hypothetical protein